MVENIFRSGLTLFSLEICFFLEYSQLTLQFQPDNLVRIPDVNLARAAVVHLNFRAGSTFPVPVCTVPSSMDWTSRCNKDDAVRLYASYMLNVLLLKGQRCVTVTREGNPGRHEPPLCRHEPSRVARQTKPPQN